MHPVEQLLHNLREEVRHRRHLKECGEDGSCGCECGGGEEPEIHHPELEVEDGQLKVEFPIAEVNVEDSDWDEDDHPEYVDPDDDGDIDLPCDEIHVEEEMEPEDEFPILPSSLESSDMINGDPAITLPSDGEEFEERWTPTQFSESIKKVKVVRNGKSVMKFKTDKPGYKIAHKNGRPVEVKMSSKELSKRKRIGKTFARKSHSSSAKQKRARSTKKHTW